MTDTLLVILEDRVAGALTRLPGGRLRFDYDDDYRNRNDATPLSVSMPIPISVHPDHVITPWLWGLLPDNEAVLRRWARQSHVSDASPFSLLSTPVGRDCAGAVRFAPPDQLDEMLQRTGSVSWLNDELIRVRLRELRADSTAWLGQVATGQFSLAGAQAKTALLRDGGRWGVPSGSIPTTHILKPAISGLDDHDLNEHMCLDAARRCGLLAARTTVERFGDESAVVVDRYDRATEGSVVTRVHQEDVCQALGRAPSTKYQNEGGPGPSDIAALVRRVMPHQIAETAVWRFIDGLIWNWLVAGTDGHAKNYSLLLAGNQVRFAPIYDIASALPYGAHEKKLRLAMKVGGDYRVALDHNGWPQAAKDLRVDAGRLHDRVVELALAAPDAFADSARTEAVNALDRPLPDRLVVLIADRTAAVSSSSISRIRSVRRER